MAISTAVRCWLGVGDIGCQPGMISVTWEMPGTLEAVVPADFAEAAWKCYRSDAEWVVIFLHEGSEQEYRRSFKGLMMPTDRPDRIKVLLTHNLSGKHDASP